ncbi:hypothetical protein MVEG_10235 [Podila verticillata NRRL 6337]|nr:MAG: hypothetical protein BYD32DRAFT_450353 [Podila humilis]KFH64410.1 hypothetical protein MVEG_10235 [Podila verticillata NRRL 6337]
MINPRKPKRTRHHYYSSSAIAIYLISAILADSIVIPPARWGHVSVLCGTKLYIHGGRTAVNPASAPIGSDLYSLDISSAFNSFSVPWAALTPGPYAAFHSVGLTGAGNSLLAVYGGNTSFGSTTDSHSLYLYNIASDIWSTSTLNDPPRREQQASATRLGDGKVFVHGGLVLSSDLTTETPTGELWTLGGYLPENSTFTVPAGLSPGYAGWQNLTSTDRSAHTASIIRSNGLLVIIGGVSGGALASMSDIQVYDTAMGTWSAQTATGATPPSRKNHVAADINGQIYVHGGTDLSGNYLSDVAILDTASWSWRQPAFEGTAPTGRYSHAATMVGSNMVISFGLTAGGATNSIFILDTIANTWTSSYTPNNLTWTSTKPEDWPGYKPPPALPQPQPDPKDPQQPQEKKSVVGPVLGGIVGVLALSGILFFAVRRHRKHQLMLQKPRDANFYRHSGYSDPRLEAAYRPTGMAFEGPPLSLGQRIKQLWAGMDSFAFWKENRVSSRSRSQRLNDQEVDDESQQGLHSGAVPSDQELFLAAVHRARSRTGIMPPNFVPLQQPITPGSPTSPRSPRLPKFPAPAGFGGTSSYSGSEPNTIMEVDEEGDHGRAYSDGFENAMLEMDIQMLAVPRGRLFVVNPSDDVVANPENTYRHFDSQGPLPTS